MKGSVICFDRIDDMKPTKTTFGSNYKLSGTTKTFDASNPLISHPFNVPSYAPSPSSAEQAPIPLEYFKTTRGAFSLSLIQLLDGSDLEQNLTILITPYLHLPPPSIPKPFLDSSSPYILPLTPAPTTTSTPTHKTRPSELPPVIRLAFDVLYRYTHYRRIFGLEIFGFDPPNGFL